MTDEFLYVLCLSGWVLDYKPVINLRRCSGSRGKQITHHRTSLDSIYRLPASSSTENLRTGHRQSLQSSQTSLNNNHIMQYETTLDSSRTRSGPASGVLQARSMINLCSSDFKAASGNKNIKHVFIEPLINELMSRSRALNPRLFQSFFLEPWQKVRKRFR